VRGAAAGVRRWLDRIRYFGVSRYCPCCRSHLRRFTPYPRPGSGRRPRPEAKCPVCGALERHRLIVRYLAERTDFWNGRPKRMLHVAPEAQIRNLFKRAPGVRYISTDLSLRRPMVQADLTRLGFGDEMFDVIYCSHVLEHVSDDLQAMRELRRVLRPGGWAILQVPIVRDTTFEDPSVTTPEGRLAAFGQRDHVRAYGKDYVDRLRAAGFAVTIDSYVRELPEATRRRLGLMAREDVYVCRQDASRGTTSREPSALDVAS
jgi:SAM-dependent methyltransferase